MQNDMAILKDPMYKIVNLKGLKPSPDARAMVCWCPTDKSVYVEIEKLPTPPKGMQYQLWAIVDGKPVSEGMLTMGSGLHRMTDVENAQAFAITLEKTGGSPTPNMDAMYVMGTV
jgi:anti-sigma-K factor RskA